MASVKGILWRGASRILRGCLCCPGVLFVYTCKSCEICCFVGHAALALNTFLSFPFLSFCAHGFQETSKARSATDGSGRRTGWIIPSIEFVGAGFVVLLLVFGWRESWRKKRWDEQSRGRIRVDWFWPGQASSMACEGESCSQKAPARAHKPRAGPQNDHMLAKVP